jgi:glycerol kinase
VVRPRVAETACLGAAYAAGLAVGFWPDTWCSGNWRADRTWRPQVPAAEGEREYRPWRRAVERRLGWVDT